MSMKRKRKEGRKERRKEGKKEGKEGREGRKEGRREGRIKKEERQTVFYPNIAMVVIKLCVRIYLCALIIEAEIATY